MANEKEATLLLKIKTAGEESLEFIGDKLKVLGAAVITLGTAMAGFIAKGIQNFHEQEQAVNKLNQAMANSGMYSQELSKRYQEQASALQKVTLFGDEAIVNAQANIQAMIGQREVSQGLTKATLDFAQAMGMDLANASEVIGKTIGSSTNMLGRYGIEIDSTKSKAEKMELVIKALNARFGGQAEAAAQGLGVIGRLKNAFSDYMETVGARFAPFVETVGNLLIDAFDSASQSGSRFNLILEGMASITQFVAAAAIGLFYNINSLGASIGIGLAAAVESIKQALQGNFTIAKDIITGGMSEIKNTWSSDWDEMKDKQSQVWQSLSKGTEEHNQQQVESLKIRNQEMMAIQAEKDAADYNAMLLKQEEERGFLDQKFYENMTTKLAQEQMMNDALLMQKLTYMDAEIAAEENRAKKIELISKRNQMLKDEQTRLEKSRLTGMQQFQDWLASEDVKRASGVFGQISTLQQSKNKELVAIGKAAAIAQITISTAEGVGKAWAMGPILGPIMAPLVIAAGAIQAGKVAGVALAEGGIVRATPGGVPAIIGEGGRDEAVIPLDSSGAMSRLGGQNVTVVFNGPLMGNEEQAREFARVIDRQLLELRRGNESVAFDSGVT